ncbi:MAG: nucleoside hydrolase [Candidatus Latescibacteria bacterium]|nr:nucleoside hydrolase [Candidatus Latescibacterota bacterium]
MGSETSDSRPVILDADPGVDDALAIMLALGSPELAVLGICTVSGNVSLDIGTGNALRVLALLGRDEVPVYPGAGGPLRREAVYATEVHGPGGLGDSALPLPGRSSSGDAVSFLIETLSALPGEVTLIAVGPLTNLALAEARAPGVLKKAREVCVMGGAVDEPGNITPVAEFNFFADPEAARQVVRSGASITLAPLDVTHRVALEASHLAEMPATPTGRFVRGAVRPAMELAMRVRAGRQFFLHDPLAVGLAICPSLFRIETVFADVETGGDLTAGQVVADRRLFTTEGNRKGLPIRCALDVDAGRFLALFFPRIFSEAVSREDSRR